ncbi:sulfatase family protein [Haloterrigena alkaliphila]|uniref:Sulfatase n=1 Tax=Haloterrigena alkaliphila TaxID=2816475 RepID=A0A8A2VGC2_9EURY|nr:sulfatase [Haloterrigena alkaliphila]QSW99740.1 sulfatase [Haloterrigena alkaliphila]
MDSPNVLLIHCHDLGQYIGCYDVDIETPNLERLADEGARFANHFTTAPQCSPSRSSLFTGCYPHVNGLLGLAHTDWELDTERTLPQRLSDAGYETHLFGLQHISESPENIGYDEIHTAGRLSPNVAPELHSVNRAADVADTLSQYLNSGLNSPFFASVGFFEAHRLETDEPDEEEGAVLYGYGDRYDADDPDEIEVPGYLPDEPGIREDLAAMRGMVYAVDDALGTILDALESAGLEEETLVLFTTEHGIAFPRAKGTCYDPGVEAFLLARYPPLIDGGTVYEELVSNVDVMPTVLDLAIGETPADIDGYSLVPLLDDARTYSPRDRVFAEITWHGTYNPIRAVRTERFKYIRNFWHNPRVFLPNDVYASRAGKEVRGRYGRPSRVFEELYDLESDPHERENVADEADYEQVRAKLESTLATWMHETDDPILEGPVRPDDYDEMFDGLE